MLRIGVVLNEKQEIASIMDGVKIAVYEKKESGWFPTYEVKNYLGQKETIDEMREFIQQLILELKGCKILVAFALTGIPFMMLDKEGFMLCEAEEISERLFEEIAYDYAKTEQEKLRHSLKLQIDYPSKPFETNIKGIFELDLKKLQECHPQISSKMAVIPFLKEETFYQLNLYCDHVMPWLEHNPIMLGYQYEVIKLESKGYQVCIGKKLCR
ncbi:Fe-only nitrogenase accessory AnfO family protein [Konateibacter massiliensis]|uniref:Fe-only nitrogenase accessory AnfO family protein n=1 Tax=Konateibacter massiliensis TaxID=2002841 RepID=UPI000C1489E5|nr:Fe-only nitrogenase accessory AnfO family protein [Konateibacter massiliensis]